MIGAVIIACYRSIRAVDQTLGFDLPVIPAKIDPYQIAYLRGGENETTRVAVASLVQRGLLQMTEYNKVHGKTQKDRPRS